MLKFLGRGAGFSDEHNGACFRKGKKLILIDCPMVSFVKLKNLDYDGIDELVIAITHTHSDHIAGLALTIHYSTFITKRKVTVIAPSEEVKKDLAYLFDRLDGCDKETYRLITAEDYMKEEGSGWMKAVILTEHVPLLSGRCFGYNLEISGKNTIYTGDTCTLEPYIPYLSEGSILYTECTAFESDVHMYVDRLMEYEDFFKEKNIKVYLMHMNNEEEILSKIAGTGFELAPLL
jgi:Metal-dependent hydrolases of the beta-lactamase superfamily III